MGRTWAVDVWLRVLDVPFDAFSTVERIPPDDESPVVDQKVPDENPVNRTRCSHAFANSVNDGRYQSEKVRLPTVVE
jgi:hypothetical protein